MLLKEKTENSVARGHSLEEQAKALALVLSEEFGVPFVFHDAATGTEVWNGQPSGNGELAADPSDWFAPEPLDPDTLAAVAADGRARVQLRADGSFQLTLLLYESGQPVLVAGGRMPSLVSLVADSIPEQARLQKWLQAVGDRLRLADQLRGRHRSEDEQHAQATTAWETVLVLDQLLRRVRLHKEPAKNQQRILEAAFAQLGVQTLVWVPQQPDAPLLIQGEACLATADYRPLAQALTKSPDFRPSEPFLCNEVRDQSWAARFPSVVNLLAFTVLDQNPVGWVLAINKKASSGRGLSSLAKDNGQRTTDNGHFRKSDAALLTAFVGLFELHARGSARYQDLKDLLVGLTRSLTSAIDAKDSYTFGHSERVARIAVELAREMGMKGDELGDVYLSGLLHDVGKIGVRDAILSKPGPLTAEEFEHIKQHVTIGYTILADLHAIRNLLPGVLYHHERYDGGGYPDGLAGEAIPLLARILAVADAYDAMSTTRPYRDALPCRRVEETLVQGAGTHWDKRVIDAFMRCRQKVHAIRQRGVGESLRHAIDGALRDVNQSMPWKPEGRIKPV